MNNHSSFQVLFDFFLLFLSLAIKIYWKLNVDWESDVAENVFEEDAGKEIDINPDKFHTLNT